MTSKVRWMVAALTVCATTGCGAAKDAVSERVTEAAIEAGSNGDVDVDYDEDGSFSIESEEGVFSVEQGSVPASWPAEVPLPAEYDEIFGSEISDSGSLLVTVGGTTQLSIDAIDAAYSSALQAWTESFRSNSSSNGDRSLQIAFDRDGQSVVVALSEANGVTNFSISYSKQPT